MMILVENLLGDMDESDRQLCEEEEHSDLMQLLQFFSAGGERREDNEPVAQ